MTSDQKTMTAAPDLYLRTPKVMTLSVIKLLEAVFAIYFAYIVFAKETVTSEFLNLLSVQGYSGGVTESTYLTTFISRIITNNNMSYTELSNAMDTIETISRILIGGMFTLVAVEGLSFASSVWMKQGAGIVKAIRIIRLVAAVLCLIWIIYDVADTISNLSKRSSDFHTSMTKLIETYYGSVFKFIVQIITYLAAPIIMIIYHTQVIKVTGAAQTEIHMGRMFGTPMHRLEKIAGFVAAVFAAGALITFVRSVGNGEECNDLITYIGIPTYQTLFAGVKFMSCLIVAAMTIKYILVCLCSLDFDRIHRQNRT